MLSVLLQQGFNALQRGDAAQAAPLFEAALKIDPANFDALHLLGLARMEQGLNDEACALIERALLRRPGEPMALCNLGIARRATGDLEAAEKAYRQALASRPEDAALHYNLGNALADLFRFDEAIEAFRHAQRLAPQDPSNYWNEALIHLVRGDLAAGWEGYEWGWLNGARDQRYGSNAPLWDGSQALAGRTILVWAEQGYGDTIQFVRYLPLLAARGATVVLECQRTLGGLMAGLEGLSQVVVRGEALPAHDFQCPLMSLPRGFGTTLENIPAPAAYLAADPARIARQAASLPAAARRVGLVWSGSTSHQDDSKRSLALQSLLPMIERARSGTAFICLQKDLRRSDTAALARLPADFFRGEAMADFADTAALIMNLDLIISVDTAVAHLAAALGKPVWLLVPHKPDWRWLLEREDSPWYPSLRLFRQKQAGDWSEVLTRLTQALAE